MNKLIHNIIDYFTTDIIEHNTDIQPIHNTVDKFDDSQFAVLVTIFNNKNGIGNQSNQLYYLLNKKNTITNVNGTIMSIRFTTNLSKYNSFNGIIITCSDPIWGTYTKKYTKKNKDISQLLLTGTKNIILVNVF
jgi:hypothetical protein